jgi:hypothetical protein
MKVFTNIKEATKSLKDKKIYYLNSICPFSISQKLCGSWCSLFYINKPVKNNSNLYIILACKSDNRKLYVETLIDNN